MNDLRFSASLRLCAKHKKAIHTHLMLDQNHWLAQGWKSLVELQGLFIRRGLKSFSYLKSL
jgi:hypothetical protein